jgi:hypothetical protein
MWRGRKVSRASEELCGMLLRFYTENNCRPMMIQSFYVKYCTPKSKRRKPLRVCLYLVVYLFRMQIFVQFH